MEILNNMCVLGNKSQYNQIMGWYEIRVAEVKDEGSRKEIWYKFICRAVTAGRG